MNKERREKISEAIKKLDESKNILEGVQFDEDAARDRMPESLQGSERYEYSEHCSDVLDDAISSIETVVGDLEEM